MQTFAIYVDGAIGDSHTSGKTGIAAVALSPNGYFLGWESRQLEPMTNNEAEYQAALLGLKLGRALRAKHVHIFTDSQVVVWQMQGYSRVNSPNLKHLHRQTCQAAARFHQVQFEHIGREKNRLADALAANALEGKCVQTSPRDSRLTNWVMQALSK